MNNSQRIRELNDELRQNLRGGLAVMTPGVANDLFQDRLLRQEHDVPLTRSI
jgi:hypothetical protein